MKKIFFIFVLLLSFNTWASEVKQDDANPIKDSEVLQAIHDLFQALENDDQAVVLEKGLFLKKKYAEAKADFSKKIDSYFEDARKSYEKYFKDLPINKSDNSLVSLISYITDSKNNSSSKLIETNFYELRLVSSYSKIDSSDVYLAIRIIPKNKYYSFSKIEDYSVKPMTIDYSGSENVEYAELYKSLSRPITIEGRKFFIYDTPFYYPVFVKLKDKDKPMDLKLSVSFELCPINVKYCRTFTENIEFSLEVGKNSIPTVYKTEIQNHFNARIGEEFSYVKIMDSFYSVYNGALALFLTAEYPIKPSNVFLAVENSGGDFYKTVLLNRHDEQATFVATLEGLMKEDINSPLTIMVGDKNTALETILTPPFKQNNRYQDYDDGIPYIRIFLSTIFGLLVFVVVAKYRKMAFYKTSILYSMLKINGIAFGFFLLFFVFLSFIENNKSIENEDQIIKALENDKVVYISYDSPLCYTCKYNNFVLRGNSYAKGLLQTGKLEIFEYDKDNEEQRKIIEKFGLNDASRGYIFSKKAYYGVSLPKVLTSDVVQEILHNLYGVNVLSN